MPHGSGGPKRKIKELTKKKSKRKEPEMKLIAGWIADVVNDFEGSKDRVTAEVIALCEKFPIYED